MFDELDTVLDGTLDQRLQRVESELLWRGAHLALCGRSSIHCRAFQTLRLLQSWEQPPWVQLAGTLYAAYRPPDGRAKLFASRDRALIRDMIGEEAERLVHMSSLARNPLDAVTADSAVTDPILAQLAVLHIADAACTSALDGAPAPWVARASRFARRIAVGGKALPVFDDCTSVMSPDSEAQLLDAYCRCLEACASSASDVETLNVLAEAAPWLAEPFILTGLAMLVAGDGAAAARCGERAIRLIRGWNTAWDKRLSAMQWLGLAQLLQRCALLDDSSLSYLGARIAVALKTSGGRPEVIYGQLEAIDALGNPTAEVGASLPDENRDPEENWEGGSDFDLLPFRFTKYIAGLRDNTDSPTMAWYPDIDARAIWDVLELESARELQARSAEIAVECLAVEQKLFLPSMGRANLGPEWRLFPLFERGVKNATNCARLPVSTEIVERHHDVILGLGGSVFVGRLAPRERTAPRGGSTNIRLRCLLGIDVPEPSGVTVNGLRERMRAGRCIVFADSALREHWNDTERDQVVLLLDLRHPDLTNDEVSLLEGLFRYGAATAGGHRDELRLAMLR